MGKLLESLKNKSKKIFSNFSDKILLIETLFLIFFIPLYPKIPLVDIKNTWVYVRVEDFVVLFVLLSWLILLLKKKVTIKTPLTIPILIFWLIGGIATIHAVLIIFPTIANVFSNVAFFSYLRHIEYLSLFFIAYSCLNDKKYLPFIIWTLVITLVAIVFYGFGQKYLGLPAYLTMNEEFAKGIPIRLSSLSRVPSTFAGHYDLAAYLVLVIPILISLIFGFRNWFIKISLAIISFLGIILLFMTVSRISFFVLFAALAIVFFFQKKKLVLFLAPLAVIFGFIFIFIQPTIIERFKSTVSQVDVLVDAKTGDSLGHVKYVPKEYFKDKIVLLQRVRDKEELARAITGVGLDQDESTESAILKYKNIADEVPLVTAVNVSTGESLPQGTGYINLYLSPVTRRLGNFFYELPGEYQASPSAQFLVLQGDFLVKKASAYDLSFTTRFQGEWPRAVLAFNRNLLFGSGYGSVSLAVDNNYLRILGETGILGFISFFSIFLVLGLYIRRIYPNIPSRVAKSFVLGSFAGIFGLGLNAILIDVFEASKVAFTLWILTGVNLRLLTLYQKSPVNIISEIKKIIVAPYSIIFYLFALTFILYSKILGNYFVGDDFTWLRWVADCTKDCSIFPSFIRYFTEADGFFYRPGTKIYFYLMHNFFWLNQVVYHLVSLILHFTVASLFYLLGRKIFKNNLLAAGAAFIFLILSGYSESVFWISSTGYLFNAVFGLLTLLLFILWEEQKKVYFLAGSILSITFGLLFHELGVVFPLFILAYKLTENGRKVIGNIWKRADFLALFIPLIFYLAVRFLAKSHWFSGDYSYDVINLPFNIFGNLLAYSLVVVLGNAVSPIFVTLRLILRENVFLAAILIGLSGVALLFLYKKFFSVYRDKIDREDLRVITFGALFFIISLLPFLGLGNITSRYTYLASAGLSLILILLLKKVFDFSKYWGRTIAISATSIFVLIFVFFHLIQIQQAYFDWYGAGDRSRKFFISIEGVYTNLWKEGEVELHFVNVPTRIGQAWIFPVGLEDAIWFAFRNDSIKIFKHTNISSAIQAAGNKNTNFVLEFSENGSVSELERPSTSLNLIKP